jgi:hypothetical protein
VGLSFTIAAGPRQRSHSRVRVPRDSCTYFTLRFETPVIWRARSAYLYPPGTGWPSYTPRHWVPFSSPLTTRRSAVEVFEPASTRGTDSFEVRVTLRLVVYNQSVLASSPLRLTTRDIFLLSYSSGCYSRYIPPWHGPRRKHRIQQFLYCYSNNFRGNLYVCECVTQ